MNFITRIADIATSYPSAIDVFDRLNVDYYCNGAISFFEACTARNLDPEEVWKQISTPNRMQARVANFDPTLLSNLVLRHYGDIHSKVQQIEEVLSISDECHGEELNALAEISRCFRELTSLLISHTISEQQLLLITSKAAPPEDGTRCLYPNQEMILRMEHEHAQIGASINTLRGVTNTYSVETLGSPSMQLVIILLKQFDKDLTQRLHIENNILFPKLLDHNSSTV